MTVTRVIDADGHIVEDNAAIGQRMPDLYKRWKYAHGLMSKVPWFPSIGALYYAPAGSPASEARDGAPVGLDEWRAFLDDTGIEASSLYPSNGLTYGLIQNADFAISLCRAYNDWLYETYLEADPRFRGMALIPLQEPEAAVEELRRAVEVLGMRGAMLPANGLRMNLGVKTYWPVYAEADRLGCCLAIHGGYHNGLGFDTMNAQAPTQALGHSLGMMIALGGIVFNGVFDRFPNLRIAFLESGVAWLLCCLERFDGSEKNFIPLNLRGELLQLGEGESVHDHIVRHITEGRIFVACKGDELMLSDAIEVFGSAPLVYASDFPLATSGAMCRNQVRDIAASERLSETDKEGILFRNAERLNERRPATARSSAAE